MRRSMYVAVTVPYTKIVQVESYMWMDGCVGGCSSNQKKRLNRSNSPSSPRPRLRVCFND